MMTALVDCVWVKKKYAPDDIVTDRIKTGKGKARKFIFCQIQMSEFMKPVLKLHNSGFSITILLDV